LAEKHGAERWIDLDYRPVLWGLGGKGDGETRFIADDGVTEHLQGIAAHLDVIVGTEEEFHIAGGSTDTIACLRTLRALTAATFVVKLGHMGCAVFEGSIPDSIEAGLIVEGFPVEVFNVLGAGDAFMGGLLTGRLEGRGWAEACRFANACGALAVSRHACAPAYPSREELDHFLANGSPHFRLREDARLERLHRNSTRHGVWPEVLAFAFDHRAHLEALSDDPARIAAFKSLCADVLTAAQDRHPERQLGALCDHRFGQDALDRLTGRGLWLAAPIERPGSRPLTFEGGASLAGTLHNWPRTHCVKCLVSWHPDDPEALRQEQEARLVELYEVTRAERLELLLEIIPPAGSDIARDTVARAMEQIYALGITPDWWKLKAPDDPASWYAWEKVIPAHDPHCQGVLILGLDAPLGEVAADLAACRAHPLCKGFAVGRTVFGEAAKAWFSDEIDDSTARAQMAERLDTLIAAFAP
ncbi:MAG: PfkB family carbohydrate kinase, partial [Pseudomonadota bacterium]